MQERIVGLMGERSMLIGAISHDLKTYLTRMRLRAERVAEPDRRERLIDDLDTMTALIETSLGFARGTAAEVGRARSTSPTSWRSRWPSMPRRAARITPSGEEVPDATVAGDAVALRRVVANLIGNAVKFGRSSVAVAVRRAGAACEVVIEDDGPGIPEAERSRCSAPTTGSSGRGTGETGGTGLGLAIARQIAEAHGGTIVAEAASTGGARSRGDAPGHRLKPVAAPQPPVTRRYERARGGHIRHSARVNLRLNPTRHIRRPGRGGAMPLPVQTRAEGSRC